MHLPFFWLTLPVAATLSGGLLALRLAHYRAALVAVGAGLLLGSAFLDLLPEAIVLGESSGWKPVDVLGTTLLCFLGFMLFEAALEHYQASVPESQATPQTRRLAGQVAGGMLIFHSFRDGMAIGAAFAASHPVGYAVATGIAAHDLGDGMNTVLLTTGGRKARWPDYLFLALDAAAPFAGGVLAVWWLISSSRAVVLLALAAGFFLQMATNDFLPQLKGQGALDRRLLVLGVLGGASIISMANWLLLR